MSRHDRLVQHIYRPRQPVLVTDRVRFGAATRACCEDDEVQKICEWQSGAAERAGCGDDEARNMNPVRAMGRNAHGEVHIRECFSVPPASPTADLRSKWAAWRSQPYGRI